MSWSSAPTPNVGVAGDAVGELVHRGLDIGDVQVAPPAQRLVDALDAIARPPEHILAVRELLLEAALVHRPRLVVRLDRTLGCGRLAGPAGLVHHAGLAALGIDIDETTDLAQLSELVLAGDQKALKQKRRLQPRTIQLRHVHTQAQVADVDLFALYRLSGHRSLSVVPIARPHGRRCQSLGTVRQSRRAPVSIPGAGFLTQW
ncbi:MAG: hypothetical protein P8009_03570 [Gammaproteobacteria bacterium]